MTWCWKNTAQLHLIGTCESGAAGAHCGQGMRGGPGMLCVKDPKVVPLCSIADVPLCSGEFQTYIETKKWKKYLYLSNVKVTPCGLISSLLCSNARLAKHPSFSQTQDSHPWQTQLSTSTSFSSPIQPLALNLVMLCCCQQCPQGSGWVVACASHAGPRGFAVTRDPPGTAIVSQSLLERSRDFEKKNECTHRAILAQAWCL